MIGVTITGSRPVWRGVNYEAFGVAVAAHRVHFGKSVNALARRAGVSPGVVRRAESQNPIAKANFVRLCKVMKFYPAEFGMRDTSKEPKS